LPIRSSYTNANIGQETGVKLITGDILKGTEHVTLPVNWFPVEIGAPAGIEDGMNVSLRMVAISKIFVDPVMAGTVVISGLNGCWRQLQVGITELCRGCWFERSVDH
jgi:hypothetical protein